VGILGKEHAAPNIVRKLNDGRHLISRELYKRVILKNSPSLTFKYDASIERGVRLLHIIENLPEPLPDEEPAPEEGVEASLPAAREAEAEAEAEAAPNANDPTDRPQG
jgi:ribosome-binding factor A